MNAQRDDRSLVIDQCVKDLQEAAKDLPETVSEAGRLTCDAANAMLSRVALYEATWQKFHTGGADATTNYDVTAINTLCINIIGKYWQIGTSFLKTNFFYTITPHSL